MKTYRVTLETLSECYVYEIEAQNKESAKSQALELARESGYKENYRQKWFKVERL